MSQDPPSAPLSDGGLPNPGSPVSPAPGTAPTAVPAREAEAASFGLRLIPAIVDWLIVYALSFAPSLLLGRGSGMMVTGILFWFVLPFLYYGWFYSNKGATPGKMLMGLTVVNSKTGERLGYMRAWFREVVCKGLSLLLVGFGYIMVAIHKDRRALHDLLCDTEVRKSPAA